MRRSRLLAIVSAAGEVSDEVPPLITFLLLLDDDFFCGECRNSKSIYSSGNDGRLE